MPTLVSLYGDANASRLIIDKMRSGIRVNQQRVGRVFIANVQVIESYHQRGIEPHSSRTDAAICEVRTIRAA